MSAASSARQAVGVVGVGRMGLPMVKHLLHKGHSVSVFDISEANLEKARALGATVAETPADMARSVGFIILGVGYDDEVREVLLGKNGVFETLKPGSIVAVSSTVAPATMRELDKLAQARGSDMLDAPICRGRWFADEGKLLALFGGKQDVMERGRAVYSAFSSDIAFLGEIGHGQVGKAMNNMLLWVTSIGLIEAGRIAESTGINLVNLRAALMMSSGKSQALEDWDQTTFTWALKDMQIVMGLSDDALLNSPVAGLVKEQVKEARRIKATNPPKWTGA